MALDGADFEKVPVAGLTPPGGAILCAAKDLVTTLTVPHTVRPLHLPASAS